MDQAEKTVLVIELVNLLQRIFAYSSIEKARALTNDEVKMKDACTELFFQKYYPYKQQLSLQELWDVVSDATISQDKYFQTLQKLIQEKELYSTIEDH